MLNSYSSPTGDLCMIQCTTGLLMHYSDAATAGAAPPPVRCMLLRAAAAAQPGRAGAATDGRRRPERYHANQREHKRHCQRPTRATTAAAAGSPGCCRSPQLKKRTIRTPGCIDTASLPPQCRALVVARASHTALRRCSAGALAVAGSSAAGAVSGDEDLKEPLLVPRLGRQPELPQRGGEPGPLAPLLLHGVAPAQGRLRGAVDSPESSTAAAATDHSRPMEQMHGWVDDVGVLQRYHRLALACVPCNSDRSTRLLSVKLAPLVADASWTIELVSGQLQLCASCYLYPLAK
ncbi:hypothetical protein ACQJBY_048491 [Aegilops geniculata]